MTSIKSCSASQVNALLPIHLLPPLQLSTAHLGASLSSLSTMANYTEIVCFLPTEKDEHTCALVFPCLAKYTSAIVPNSELQEEQQGKKSNHSFTKFLSIIIHSSNTSPVF